ncbi:MAG: hypothetical protein WAN03_00220 [Candidatus Sulfotelmatobacter sp.]
MKIMPSAACFMLFFAMAGAAQTPKDSRTYQKEATVSEAKGIVHIVANSPRPLDQVLDALRLKYGWAVGYEDPRYTAAQDLTEGTSGNAAGVKFPSGGNFSAEFSANAPDEEKILRQIVDTYNHSKNPGQFEVRPSAGKQFSIAGVAAHDDKGAMTPQTPPLDVQVTLPSEERSLTATLDLLCQEISKQSHIDVAVAVTPRSLLSKTTTKLGGKAQARELLIQIIAATTHKLYWQVIYDPNSKAYLLNLHSLRAAEPAEAKPAH